MSCHVVKLKIQQQESENAVTGNITKHRSVAIISNILGVCADDVRVMFVNFTKLALLWYTSTFAFLYTFITAILTGSFFSLCIFICLPDRSIPDRVAITTAVHNSNLVASTEIVLMERFSIITFIYLFIHFSVLMFSWISYYKHPYPNHLLIFNSYHDSFINHLIYFSC